VLRNALYKFKTYLLTYLLTYITQCHQPQRRHRADECRTAAETATVPVVVVVVVGGGGGVAVSSPVTSGRHRAVAVAVLVQHAPPTAPLPTPLRTPRRMSLNQNLHTPVACRRGAQRLNGFLKTRMALSRAHTAPPSPPMSLDQKIVKGY